MKFTDQSNNVIIDELSGLFGKTYIIRLDSLDLLC